MGKNIAILASGNGTNAENIIRYFQQKAGEVQVALVVANRQNVNVFKRAEDVHVPCIYIGKEKWATGEEVVKLLADYRVDFIVLAGTIGWTSLCWPASWRRYPTPFCMLIRNAS